MSENRIQGALPYRMDASGRVDERHWAMRIRADKWADILDGVDTRGRRADAFGNEFIVPELIHISKEVNKQVFPENTFTEAFAPPVSQPPWFAKVYDYNDEEFSGSSDDDSGEWSDPGQTAGISRKPNLSPIKPIPVNFSANIAEMAQFASIGVSTMVEKATQARRMAETTADRRAWLGNSRLGIPGYATTIGMSRDTVTTTTGGDTTWEDKSGPEIYEDCRAIWMAIVKNSLGIHKPTDAWLPQKLEGVLTKPMVLGGTMLTQNVQAYIEANLNIKIHYTVRLNGIDRNGDPGNGAVAMFKKSSDVQRNIMARGYYEMGPQQVARTLTVYADVVTGGLVVPQPTSAALWDGMCAAP